MQDLCMQKNVQATLRLAETNNSQLTRPAVFSGVSVGSFPEQRLNRGYIKEECEKV